MDRQLGLTSGREIGTLVHKRAHGLLHVAVKLGGITEVCIERVERIERHIHIVQGILAGCDDLGTLS